MLSFNDLALQSPIDSDTWLGGANALFCATRITHVLKLSGGVFSNLDTPIYIRSPWELKKQLLDIYFPERGGIISGAY